MNFKNGFLIKRFTIKNLDYKNITPTIAELEDFLKGEPN